MQVLGCQFMFEQSFLATNLYYAMYAHTEDHIRSYLQTVDKSFEEVARVIEYDDVDKKLIGNPASLGFKRVTG